MNKGSIKVTIYMNKGSIKVTIYEQRQYKGNNI